MTARGIRDNNPGNVRLGKEPWVGQVLPSPDPVFCVFDSMAHGVRAAAKILLTYQATGVRSVREIIMRWAPPVENDTGAYVKAVAGACDVQPDTRISLGQGMLSRLCRAIFRHENGGDFVGDADLQAGVAMALGLSSHPAPEGHDALVAAASDRGAKS